MTTTVTKQTTATEPKMNFFMKTGALVAVLALVIPVLLTTFVLPTIPQYAPTIFGASVALSYLAAVGAGMIAFGAFQRYIAK